MKAEQLSIFMENAPGTMLAVVEVLAAKGINIRALALADTMDYGVLRLIADRPREAREALREQGFTAKVTEVVAVEIPDEPGRLAALLTKFAGAGINVEYMYTFLGRSDHGAIMIFRLDDLDRGLALITPEVGRAIPQAELSRY